MTLREREGDVYRNVAETSGVVYSLTRDISAHPGSNKKRSSAAKEFVVGQSGDEPSESEVARQTSESAKNEPGSD